MSDHVVFVGTYDIPEGAFGAWEAAVADMTDFVREHEPRMISFNHYASADHTEGVTIQVHPDSASLETHLRVAASRIQEGSQMVRVKRIELYGAPRDQVVERLRQMSPMSGNWPVIVRSFVRGYPYEGPAPAATSPTTDTLGPDME